MALKLCANTKRAEDRIRTKDTMDKILNSERRDLKKLLQTQPLAVLATQSQGQPDAKPAEVDPRLYRALNS
jgi:predicted pyridoxine 5'-phosphate oxidase superfamily flavin-nucleotide-binding protein